VEDIQLREPLFVKPEVGLLEMLGIFQEGQCHMAIVTHDPTCAADHLRRLEEPPAHAGILGIVTLEDVLEKVIQGDITDETDTSGFITALPRGVVTTGLSRKMNRSHTMGELLMDEATGSDRRRSIGRGRSRGHSASRNNLMALNSINVVAGDVRHKARDVSPRDTRNSTPRNSTPRNSLTPLGSSTGHKDFFRDVVDTPVDDVPSSDDEESASGGIRKSGDFVHVANEQTKLLGGVTSKQNNKGAKPRYS
jgi:hypothetical protein